MLAALTVYRCYRPAVGPRQRTTWLLMLILLACAPDVDYLFPALRPPVSAPDPDSLSVWMRDLFGLQLTEGVYILRTTHSFAAATLFSALSLVFIYLARPEQPLRLYAQAASASLSHLLLDLLVGVTPTALLWPLSQTAVQLPFGLLPSAPAPRLTNIYLYRNSLIELGVLLPILAITSIITSPAKRSVAHGGALLLLGAITALSMAWAYLLTR